MATFISRSTSPAAGSGRSRPKAAITAQTASSCISQPTHWKRAAPSAGTGRRSTASPCRAMTHERAQASHAVVHRPPPVRADSRPTARRAMPTRPKMTRLVTAQCGIFAVSRTHTMRIATGKRSKRRWANTVPRSVALVPLPCGRWRRRTATRASSPARAGSTALPSRPTPYAEKTWPKRGCGGGSAWLIVSRQERERASVERRLRSTPTITQRQVTTSNASTTAPHSGPRHQIASSALASSASTRMPRAHGLRARFPTRVMRRAVRASALARRSPRADGAMSSQEYRSTANARAATPIATRRGSSSSSPATASASAPGSPGSHVTDVSGVVTSR